MPRVVFFNEPLTRRQAHLSIVWSLGVEFREAEQRAETLAIKLPYNHLLVVGHRSFAVRY